MHQPLPLITTLVIAFTLALVFGFIAEKYLKSPALVGYLFAGVAAGQYTPGVFADPALANQLSEIGVMLLMFGVGLHFSIKDLWAVKGIAVPGAVLQMAIATLLGALVAHWGFGESWPAAVVLGVSLSCASTVVLLKALEVRGRLTSPDGRVAVGWLIVEDLMTVLILVLLPIAAGIFGPSGGTAAEGIGWAIAKTLLSAVLFVAVMLVAGRRVLPWAMGQVARTGSRELFTLFVLAAALGVAYGAAEIFHVSFALGAFFAGMVMRESRFAHRAATESIPLQDAFAVLFFVGCGMLFDWRILLENPFEVLAVLLIILLGKSAAAFFLVAALRYPLQTALTAAVALAQIGEFSFILIGQAAGLGLADTHLIHLVVAGAIFSIALNPVGFWAEPRIRTLLVRRFAWAKRAAMRPMPFESLDADTPSEAIEGHAVVVGRSEDVIRYAGALAQWSVPLVAVVNDHAAAEALKASGIAVVLGDPTANETWVNAHLHQARQLVLLDNGAESVRVAQAARRVSPELAVVVAAPAEGVWSEVAIKDVRFFSTADAAAGILCAQVAGAFKSGAPVGEPLTKHAHEDQTDEELASEASEKKAQS